MATDKTSSTFATTYKDDYNADDHYHRILFNSGRALQARELTQSQTIIQEEVARFGRNIFKEGAAVTGGDKTIDGEYRYVKITTVNAGGLFASIPIGTKFTGATSGVSARVIGVVAAENSDPDTLYIRYVDNGSASASSSTLVFANGETIADDTGVTSYSLTVAASDATGAGVRVTIAAGDFFALGHFVSAPEQSIILSKYSRTVDTVIGFRATEQIITTSDDNDLYDNAGNVVNTSSPGADRYKITLTFIEESDLVSGDTFIYLATIENSKIINENTTLDSYKTINDLIAQRTKEESGDYVVKPFLLSYEDGTNDSNLTAVVSAGLAYVNGYRAELPNTTKLLVPRSQATETVNNDAVPMSFGNYVLSDTSVGQSTDTLGQKNLLDSAAATIGFGRIRSVEEDGAFHRVYLFDVQMNSDKNFSDVRQVGVSTNYNVIVSETGGIAKLQDAGSNTFLFPMSRQRSDTFEGTSLTYQEYASKASGGTTQVVLDQLPLGQTYTDTDLWIVSPSDGDVIANPTIVVTNGSRDATITGLSTSTTYHIRHYINVTDTLAAFTYASKTLTSTTVTNAIVADGNRKYIDLAEFDIFEVDSVRDSDGSGADIKSKFILDNGQRDTHYTQGRLYLDSAYDHTTDVYVNFRYFEHGAGGYYYSKQSYNVPFAEIPKHILGDGTEISLRDYIDIRPDINRGTLGSAVKTFKIPRNGTNLLGNSTYFLPRADKVLVSQDGIIQVLMGDQAQSPQFKPTPDDTLELYKVIMNPNTIDGNDLSISPIEHKHYTMADIGKLEAKLDRLEEWTTLSLLELESKLTGVLDSAGDTRAESGFVVDDFSDQRIADTGLPFYSASIDPDGKNVRPSFEEENVRLIFNSSESQGVILKGDNLYLKYDSVAWQEQSLASSEPVAINPNGYIDYLGCIELSPSSDEWKVSSFDASYAFSGTSKIDTKQAFLWNNWQWNWIGRSVEDYHVTTQQMRRLENGGIGASSRHAIVDDPSYISNDGSFVTVTSTGKHVNRIVSSNTLRSTIGNRVVDIALIPWMRSRKVRFRAKGLKPNTTHVPFFDGVNVSSWCKDEPFVRYSELDSDNGNIYENNSSLSGNSALVSDANGEIEGVFLIPANRPELTIRTVRRGRLTTTYTGVRFRAGLKEFKLTDLTINNQANSGSKASAYYFAGGVIPMGLETIRTRITALAGSNLYLPYSVAETGNFLNAVNNDYVRLINPQLSGKWGNETTAITALNNYNGVMSQVISDYIGVDQLQFAGNNNSTVPQSTKPLAQTFTVDNQFGVTLTRVDLYFADRVDSDGLGVQLTIRPIENGVPSLTHVVPGSCVVKRSSQINLPATSSPGLGDLVSTEFEFEEPVFLSPFRQYAIVLTTQSPNYKVYVATLGKTVIGSTERFISSQPAPGKLYLPQSGKNYLPSNSSDLMFTLRRAKFLPSNGAGSFNTSYKGGATGSAVLRNAVIPKRLLLNNPIRTTNASSTIYVDHPCHGLAAGEGVVLSGALAVGGITAAQLNKKHTVSAVDMSGFQIALTAGTATSTTVGGGNNVLSTRNIAFNLINPYIESTIPNQTSIDIAAKFTSGKSLGGSETKFAQDASWSRITPKVNLVFDNPRLIANDSAEDSALSGNSSAYIKIDMKSGNDYVSPIIDLQRASMILVQNCIDDTGTRSIFPVPETSPNSPVGGARHITTPISVFAGAVGFELRNNYTKPAGSTFEFYYRTSNGSENIYEQPWILQSPTTPLVTTVRNGRRSAIYLAGGKGGYLNSFTQIQGKFVFRSTNSSNVPTISSMKWKFLAT